MRPFVKSLMQLSLAALLLLSTATSFAFFEQTIEVTQEQLQSQLDQSGPLRHQDALMTVSIQQAKVLLKADSDKLGFTGKVETTLFASMKANADVELRGNVIYRAEQGAFFMSNIEVVELRSEQIPAQQVPNVKRIVAGLVNQLLSTQPVYVLNNEKAEEKLAKAVLKDVTIKDGKLHLRLSAF